MTLSFDGTDVGSGSYAEGCAVITEVQPIRRKVAESIRSSGSGDNSEITVIEFDSTLFHADLTLTGCAAAAEYSGVLYMSQYEEGQGSSFFGDKTLVLSMHGPAGALDAMLYPENLYFPQ